jgi:hypothetical protein
MVHYRIGVKPRRVVFESQVHDAGTVAQWGRLSWRAQTDAGATLVFRTRSGNSQRPDKTWAVVEPIRQRRRISSLTPAMFGGKPNLPAHAATQPGQRQHRLLAANTAPAWGIAKS